MMRPGKRLYQTLIQTSVRMVSLTLEVPKSKIVEFEGAHNDCFVSSQS